MLTNVHVQDIYTHIKANITKIDRIIPRASRNDKLQQKIDNIILLQKGKGSDLQ